MAGKHASKPKLSKGILEMKFMQRTREKVKKENDVAEGREMYSDEITERMLNSNSNFIIEPSFAHCENLIEGRLSFRGMNPEIERLLELEREEKAAGERHEQSQDVSNEAMAKFYHANKAQAGAALAMDKKFSKFKKVNNNNNNRHKRHNNDSMEQHPGGGKKKKTKFMKPKGSDEEGDN